MNGYEFRVCHARAEILQQKQKDDEESVRVKAVMEEWNKARKLKSLREMREEGRQHLRALCPY